MEQAARHWSRWLLGLGLTLAGLVGFAGFGMLLLAELYATYAAELRKDRPDDLVAARASAIAVRLTPWSAQRRAEYAESLDARKDLQGAREQFRLAIRLAPADAYRWLEYEELLARWHRFDAETTLAAVQASRLGPNAWPVQLRNAWIGVHAWNFGDPVIRATWARSLVYGLRRAPGRLLRRIVMAGREQALCGFVGNELGVGRWCEAVQYLRPQCAQQAQPSDFCRRLGFGE